MTEQELQEISIDRLRGFVRDLNLEIISEDVKVDFDTSKRYSWGQRFKPNWKLIKYATENGAILTGSRALNCYTVDGKKIIDRGMRDFDFIVSREQAIELCNRFKFKYDLTKDFIEVRGHLWDSYCTYGGYSRYIPCDVHFIIKDESDIPDYNEKNGVKIATISYIINIKLNMLRDMKNNLATQKYERGIREDIEKHFNDINLTLIRSSKTKNRQYEI